LIFFYIIIFVTFQKHIRKATFELQSFVRLVSFFYKTITELSTYVDNFVDNFLFILIFKTLHN